MHYTYVLLSEADGRFYMGATRDLKQRFPEHGAGRVESTAYRRPLRLVYYEACMSPDDAFRRERDLKSGRGGRYLRQRLISSLPSIRSIKLERH